MNKLQYSEQLLQKLIGWISAVLFSIGVLFYTLQVALRLFWKSTIYWIDPTIGYLFAVSALFGAALACQHNENIKIELFKRFKRYKATALLIDSLSLLVTLLLLYIFYLHFNSVAGHGESYLSLEQLKDIPYFMIFSASLLFYLFRIIRISQTKDFDGENEPPTF